MFFVYILKSQINSSLYKGITSNLSKRLAEHNSGKTKSTKAYCPWKLIYFEECKTRQEAREREKYFKTGSGREFIRKKGLVAQLDRASDYGSEG
jgi:putative endonuclease